MLAEVFRLFLRLFSRAKRECNEFPCGRSLPSVESAIKGAGGENTKKRGRFADPFSRGETSARGQRPWPERVFDRICLDTAFSARPRPQKWVRGNPAPRLCCIGREVARRCARFPLMRSLRPPPLAKDWRRTARPT